MAGKKGRTGKLPKTLSPEKLKICPGGISTCAICRLDIEDLKYVNNLRIEKNWKYDQIRQYLKATFNISPNWNVISAHFTKHLTAELVIVKRNKRRKHRKTEVSKAIDKIPKEKRIVANKEMETAYVHLTQLATDFTQKVNQIYGLLNLDEKEIKKKLKDIDPLVGMEKVAKLSKEARELLSDLSKMRSPKIVVAHFLEQAIDQIILETGYVLTDISKNAQEDLMEALRTNKTISTKIFGKVFAEAARDYTDRMINLRRDQLSKATATLADLEKLI